MLGLHWQQNRTSRSSHRLQLHRHHLWVRKIWYRMANGSGMLSARCRSGLSLLVWSMRTSLFCCLPPMKGWLFEALLWHWARDAVGKCQKTFQARISIGFASNASCAENYFDKCQHLEFQQEDENVQAEQLALGVSSMISLSLQQYYVCQLHCIDPDVAFGVLQIILEVVDMSYSEFMEIPAYQQGFLQFVSNLQTLKGHKYATGNP